MSSLRRRPRRTITLDQHPTRNVNSTGVCKGPKLFRVSKDDVNWMDVDNMVEYGVGALHAGTAARVHAIAELTKCGYSARWIANYLGISSRTVNRLRTRAKQWRLAPYDQD